jgi:hypothetical protein
MNVYGGLSGGRGKEQTLRAEEDWSVPHIYIWRHQNEIYQTLLQKGEEKRENGNIMEKVRLFKYSIRMCEINTMKFPHIIHVR